ncbi:MAG: hypothetical protein U0797_10010 [Gemmataceae bacterium]
MTYPHRIRLRGPWEFESPGEPPCRVTMPGSWGDFAGRARYRRHFGYPGRLDEFERVWLTFDRVADRASVTLNGAELGPLEGGGEFEVTARLRPRNDLAVEVEGGPGGGLVGEVALEVRATAFLRGVSVRREAGRLVATGEVAGHADGLLELYLVVDRRPAGYATVSAGSPFELAAEEGGGPPAVAVVEMVRGAVPWFTLEFDLHSQAAQGPGA